MSPVLITLLVVAGILILIAIGYVNHVIENNKLDKARRKADLADRLRRCQNISEGIPGQFMSPALKLLLTRFELYYLEHLLPLEKDNPALRPKIQELQAKVAQGENIAVGNSPRKILSEAAAKELRFLLEGLHAQIVNASQHGMLGAVEAKNWLGEVRHILNLTYIELFSNMGLAALQQNHPGQARLAFERGVQMVTKLPDRQRYQQQLQLLSRQLERANSLVLQQTTPRADEPNELSEGLRDIDDDPWKKKNIYD